jgi:hypothetical protein
VFETIRDRMEWSEVKSSQLKVVAAGIGASALVAMGALTVVFSEPPASTGPVGTAGMGGMTLGETVTTTTGATELKTSIASPTVTASTPKGFGNGG